MEFCLIEIYRAFRQPVLTWINADGLIELFRAYSILVKRMQRLEEARRYFEPAVGIRPCVGEETILKCEKDEIVFLQGDVSDAIFYIQKGKIRLTVVSERGKEAVVGLLGVGHFFGENCLNGHPLRTTTATAIEECLITRIA